MPHFCCAGGCTNSSDKQDLSFHSLPLRDKKRLNLWITKMKRDSKFFSVNKHAKICSSHFTEDDFIEPLANKKRLKRTAVPSKFIWTEPGRESTERQVLGKLQVWHENKDEETDTASEGEGDVLDPQRPSSVSRNIQTDYSFEELDLPCQHSLSVSYLLEQKKGRRNSLLI
ncbi:putative THAP domain-containing protein 5 [Apostichopus japonicus]|uniref:Putative THAP domain-containing protein 5 n=1 Tax=Stichopus japonicus TaxID=307972 RepID=A0A2G8JKV6_STIJA|nr:putative THAP domain-containing protein 5 [Apostichopus japonicus]